MLKKQNAANLPGLAAHKKTLSAKPILTLDDDWPLADRRARVRKLLKRNLRCKPR
jgi:hypothetical protein